MWVDEVELELEAGRGGDGCVSFRREKFVEFGGPDGGDGGCGGNILFRASRHLRSLSHLSSIRRIEAGGGASGRPRNRTGRRGKDRILEVPCGTVVREADHGRVLADLFEEGETLVVARGGKGGKGNAAFATPTRRAPRQRGLGQAGERVRVRLEVRLIADVGLVGLPNAGKSTLLSRISAARPRVAPYPFTTRQPELGVVEWKGETFTVADLPGLIEGAHTGKGLGLRFLRHIERTRLLLHLVDGSLPDPERNYRLIRKELEEYPGDTVRKPEMVVITKSDLGFARPRLDAALMEISAVTGEGIESLLDHLIAKLKELPAPEPYPAEGIVVPVSGASPERGAEPIEVEKVEEGIYELKSAAVRRYLEKYDPGDLEGWRRFWRFLERIGAVDELRGAGVRDGETVIVEGREMEYFE
ncbi:MAG: GTPase ObgE [Candidatus Hydrogenedentota bacterium]|nr:MAG: GTPase ObgE [Candidatus Hydrogenedentota bacterium]